VTLPPDLVGHHADGNQIVAAQHDLRIGGLQLLSLRQPLRHRRERGHGRHPFRILSHCASATAAAAAVVEIFVGHGRENPSLGHLRVASTPILLP
jgi:hypothetical protein